MKFDGLYELTPAGLDMFQKAFTGQIGEEMLDLSRRDICTIIPNTLPFEVKDWNTAREMADSIIAAAKGPDISTLFDRLGLWGWLAFVSRDVVYPRSKDGRRKLGEVHRWYPSDLNDFQKGQRHLVRMPVILSNSFGKNAEHLLLGPPSVPGELREQLTSQQDMFHPAFQEAAQTLYYDTEKKTLRRGAAGKLGGSARRLAKVRLQLDVTWDLFALSPAQILEKLPKEFDQFKASTPAEKRVKVVA